MVTPPVRSHRRTGPYSSPEHPLWFQRTRWRSRSARSRYPDIQFSVVGYCHRGSPPGLEEKIAHITFPRKISGPEVSDTRLHAVEKSVFHQILLLSLVLWMLVTGRCTIIGTTSFLSGAMWQVIMVVFKICFSIEKTYNHLPHCPSRVIYVSGGASNSEMSR